jgi:hypothetical protein
MDEFEAAMARIRVQTEAAAVEMVAAGSMLLVAHAQQNFQGSHARGAAHVGGAMPNIVSGDLRRSIAADPVTHVGPGVVRTEIAPRMVYGRRVELGMNGGGYPFFQPGVEAAIPEIRARFREIAASRMKPS